MVNVYLAVRWRRAWKLGRRLEPNAGSLAHNAKSSSAFFNGKRRPLSALRRRDRPRRLLQHLRRMPQRGGLVLGHLRHQHLRAALR